MSALLVAGLGNPGDQYERNRHNVGWLALDALAESLNTQFQMKSPYQSWVAQGRIGIHKVILSKPTTFMNLSGQAIQKLAAYYKIDPADVLVICDDVHIDFGRLRLREKGSSGGQNGIQNVIKCLGTQEFPRLKVGVGPMPDKQNMKNFVLQNFSKAQWQDLPFVLQHVVSTVEKWAKEDDLKAIIQHCNSYRLNP